MHANGLQAIINAATVYRYDDLLEHLISSATSVKVQTVVASSTLDSRRLEIVGGETAH